MRKRTLVAVIASLAEMQRAIRLRRLPDYFELRLDALHRDAAVALEHAARLRAPIIITARHPAEGGVNRLPARTRRNLLLSFFRHAAFVDVELRSVGDLRSVLEAADDSQVGRIISVHDFRCTPELPQLEQFARKAQHHRADIFKIATRANSAADASRAFEFFAANKKLMPTSAMCFGEDSRALRLRFAREGSALNYTHLGTALAEGQWSFAQFRRALQRNH